ncbi:hypothetical protein VFPBJ_06814 [Purpureocillium lilacinum]|uniref:Uncharacterized protein n=1 Tax=Purpureocillium lilacinum TaxID=33203 RepID=A0A179GN05_PURLI|nr:hypothetical protein VFPBJ_06814 [Purpureocillium lilacinum]
MGERMGPAVGGGKEKGRRVSCAIWAGNTMQLTDGQKSCHIGPSRRRTAFPSCEFFHAVERARHV